MATLLGAERRARLLEILARDGALRLDPVAEELGVSAMTVRRDLDDLEAEGLARRVRGGAVAPVLPRPFGDRMSTRSAAKAAIARKALDLVPETGAAAFDASTTSGVLLGEVVARVGARLRVRAGGGTVLRHGRVALDLLHRVATVDEVRVELSAREWTLAEVFLRHPDQALDREELLRRVWALDFDPGSNVVDVYVAYLRRKLGDAFVETVRGVGYRLGPPHS